MWRGPADNSIAERGNDPVQFSAADDLLLKVERPGKGESTPIDWEDRIFLTSAIGDEEDGIAESPSGLLCGNRDTGIFSTD